MAKAKTVRQLVTEQVAALGDVRPARVILSSDAFASMREENEDGELVVTDDQLRSDERTYMGIPYDIDPETLDPVQVAAAPPPTPDVGVLTHERMNRLEAHLALMQEMAARYLTPEPYVSTIADSTPVSHDLDDKAARDDLFIGDILHMLDGPEQRAAQAQ